MTKPDRPQKIHMQVHTASIIHGGADATRGGSGVFGVRRFANELRSAPQAATQQRTKPRRRLAEPPPTERGKDLFIYFPRIRLLASREL